MKALIIKERWLNLILDGKKTWEIRGSNTKHRGTIALACSGTGQIWGQADILDSFPINRESLANTVASHQVEDLSLITYANPHAWSLIKVVRYETPKPYKHPQGAVIWVLEV